MLSSLKDILPVLRQRRLCLAGFDIAAGQSDFVLGVLRACEQARCPALMLVYAPAARYVGLEACVDLVRGFASRSTVPVVLHLDHGQDEQEVTRALELGFRSVMFDGSTLPLEENIRRTSALTRLAHSAGATIEAELGHIGSEHGDGSGQGVFTDPTEAERFVAETGVDMLAPAVGNAHGFYKQEPKLRFDLLEQMAARTGIALSLHGGTGLPMADIRRAGELGVCKLNVASLVHRQFAEALKSASIENTNRQYSWLKALLAGRSAVGDTVSEYLRELGTEGLC